MFEEFCLQPIERNGRGVEIRTPGLLRPRQARYQAALRPDMKYVKIIKYLPTELLLHPSNLASME
jgi:hypothetical protein